MEVVRKAEVLRLLSLDHFFACLVSPILPCLRGDVLDLDGSHVFELQPREAVDLEVFVFFDYVGPFLRLKELAIALLVASSRESLAPKSCPIKVGNGG
jgi:hypothetical protein